MLRLLPPAAGPTQRFGHDPGRARDAEPQSEPRPALDVHAEEPAGAGAGVEVRAGVQLADVRQFHAEPPSDTDAEGDAATGGAGHTDAEGASDIGGRGGPGNAEAQCRVGVDHAFVLGGNGVRYAFFYLCALASAFPGRQTRTVSLCFQALLREGLDSVRAWREKKILPSNDRLTAEQCPSNFFL